MCKNILKTALLLYCIFRSKFHNLRPVILVAGSSNGLGMKKAEFLDFTTPNASWQQCKLYLYSDGKKLIVLWIIIENKFIKNHIRFSVTDLPKELKYGPRMVPNFSGHGLILTYLNEVIDITFGKMYQLNRTPTFQLGWKIRPKKLQISRYSHVFLPVPSDILNC